MKAAPQIGPARMATRLGVALVATLVAHSREWLPPVPPDAGGAGSDLQVQAAPALLAAPAGRLADADFAARCSDPAVVRCYGFDDPLDLAPRVFDPWGGSEICSDAQCWQVDPIVRASGEGSLRFEIPSNSPADTSGSFWMNFADDLTVQFGENEIFNPFDPFEEPFGAYDFKLQNARPDPYCLYSQGQANPAAFFPPDGNCYGYAADQWMTFEVLVQTGPRLNDEFTNSRVRLWIGGAGQPIELAIDWGPYHLTAGPPAEDQRFGKIWLLPYNTGKDPSQMHPVAFTWYDELIISRAWISAPGAGLTPRLPLPLLVR